MRISKVQIQNFRNFDDITVEVGRNLLLVGANATGKTNFIYALRLVLDPSLSRRDRQLTSDDFWRGNGKLPWRGREIKVSIELTDFEDNRQLRTFLDDCCAYRPGFAILNYLYAPKGNIEPEKSSEKDYTILLYGGDDKNNELPPKFFDHLNLRVIGALRDAESELIARRMPLRALFELYQIQTNSFDHVITHLAEVNKRVEEIPPIKTLEEDIRRRLENLKEQIHEIDPVLRLAASSAEDVVRALRVLLEQNLLLPLNTTSLGLANILYLALSLIEIEKRESINKPIGQNEYEYVILAIEEPEAHLHPHVQRIIFRDFLKRSPLILSTHSSHIASVAPIDSILMFRKPSPIEGAQISSTARLSNVLEPSEIEDIERYLDVTKAEILFARAVIFIEGDAEEFLLATLARLVGIDLDRLGITVCNIRGTNFKPYISFVGPQGLNIPYAVLTDGDKYANLIRVAIPQAKKAGRFTDEEAQQLEKLSPSCLRTQLEDRGCAYYSGLKRCLDLLDAMQIDPIAKSKLNTQYKNCEWAQLIQNLKQYGIFVNQWSLEPELIKIGYGKEILETLEECGAGEQIVAKLHSQLQNLEFTEDNVEYWLKQIDTIGKGRVGQRLAGKLQHTHLPGGKEIPSYISEGFNYLIHSLDPISQL